ncbi:hypothetical protein KFE25_000128 [Diacronema lutheri]|uniref:UFSP1/2/DUB catalytic domain-containing protein n=1 Tax=Diacronema lutheri TaxID=2081491 RepID=A0A8J5XR84_DIALT|nr:hypothetical protein KFE25_000128 [Diacronema lutheri]
MAHTCPVSALPGAPSGWRIATVREFVHRHYGDDGFDDAGWGCGYRSLQSILSAYPPYRDGAAPVPSIPEIQRMLARMGAKPERFAGSREWLGGAYEVSLVVEAATSAPVRLVHAGSGREVPALLPQVLAHFEAHGAPGMIGGGADVYSKTLLGVALPPRLPLTHEHIGEREAPAGPSAYLLLADPHFFRRIGESAEAARERALAGGWVGWKPVENLLAASFYNFALPLPPPPGADGVARGHTDAATEGARPNRAADPHSAARTAVSDAADFEIEVVESG